MKLKLVAACSTAVLALCGATAASAGSGNNGSQHHAKQKLSVKAHVAKLAMRSGVEVGAVFDAAVAYLKIDKQALFQDLRNGQSLAQIAVAQGKTAGGLVDAVVTAAQAQLDFAVTAGKLDAAKEQALLTKLRASLGSLVTKTASQAAGAITHRPAVTAFLQPVLDYLHLELQTVLDELHSGKTLAQIAAAHGKTADGLTAAIVAAGKTKLDAAVAAGRLSATQEGALVAMLQGASISVVNGAHS